jgi:predicted Fe-Mo cluster-binding NifX family protein
VKIVVSSIGDSLDAQVSPIFGRCPYLIVVDAESMDFQAIPNAAVGASGGAGIQSAQFVAQQGVEVVLTGNVGPNAMGVLNAAGIKVYPVNEMTVRQAVEAYRLGDMQQVSQATVAADTGKASTLGSAAAGGAGRAGGMGRGGGGRGFGSGGTGRGGGGGGGGGYGAGRR